MMKIKKERKPFKREYIPIILAILILFLLIGALIYLIGHDFKFEEENVNPGQHEQEEVLIDNSNSKCSKDELNELYKIAENIKVETEMREIEDPDNMVLNQETDEFEHAISIVPVMKFTNLNSKVYIYMSNDYNDKNQEVKADTDKTEINGIQSDKIVEYTIEVRSNDYSCKGETIRKFTVKTPIYNSFSELDICEDYPEYPYCQKYLAENLPTMNDFQLGLQKYKKTLKSTAAPRFSNGATTSGKKDETTTTTVEKKEDKKESKDSKTIIYIIIGVIVLLSVVAIGTLLLMKKKRSKEV